MTIQTIRDFFQPDFRPHPHKSFGEIVQSVIYELPLIKVNSEFMTRNTRKFLKLGFIGDLITLWPEKTKTFNWPILFEKKIKVSILLIGNICPTQEKLKITFCCCFCFRWQSEKLLGWILGVAMELHQNAVDTICHDEASLLPKKYTPRVARLEN